MAITVTQNTARKDSLLDLCRSVCRAIIAPGPPPNRDSTCKMFSGVRCAFALAAGLFVFGWYMYFPYQLGMLAALDRDERPLILANAVAGIGIGIGIGPLILSFYLVDIFIPVFAMTGMFLMFGLALSVLIVLISKNEIKAE